jgi:hypothetical protein
MLSTTKLPKLSTIKQYNHKTNQSISAGYQGQYPQIATIFFFKENFITRNSSKAKLLRVQRTSST